MLKTTIFFLFGCSLYFGQTVATTGVPATQNSTSSGNGNVKDGTRTTDTPGQGGLPFELISLYSNQGGNNLRVSVNQEDRKFEAYTIVDIYGIVKKQGKINAANSYSIDISSLGLGNYWIQIEIISPYEIVSKKFIK